MRFGRTHSFTPQHETFLAELGHASAVWRDYPSSTEAHDISALFNRTESLIRKTLHAELTTAWHDALQRLQSWPAPLVLAHRDFAPWNMHWSNEAVFVFDWEYAACEANPLYDFFHFHLMPEALCRWRLNGVARIESLISAASQHAQKCYPEIAWPRQIVSSLLVSYLLHVILFYTNSDGRFNARHPVVSRYVELVHKRDQWPAA